MSTQAALTPHNTTSSIAVPTIGSIKSSSGTVCNQSSLSLFSSPILVAAAAQQQLQQQQQLPTQLLLNQLPTQQQLPTQLICIDQKIKRRREEKKEESEKERKEREEG